MTTIKWRTSLRGCALLVVKDEPKLKIMEVEFTKAHPSGIKKGRRLVIADQHGQRWIHDGYAVEVVAKKTEAAKKATPKKKAAPKKK